MERFGDLIYSKEKEEKVLGEKHTPFIEAPNRVSPDESFEVTIVVGKEVPHPNTIEHHIKWIQVFVKEDGRPFNPIHVATFDLGPAYGEPSVKFKMKLKRSSTIHVIEYCNLHGIWEASKKIEVG
jgi:superoxide reductase